MTKVVHIVYRAGITADLKVFEDPQQAKIYVRHLANLGEGSLIATRTLPDNLGPNFWVMVGPEGPSIHPTLAETPPGKSTMAMVISLTFNS